MESIGVKNYPGRDLEACLAHLTGYPLSHIEEIFQGKLNGRFTLAHAMQFLYLHRIHAFPWAPGIKEVLSEEQIRMHIKNGGVAIIKLDSYSDGWCVASDCLLYKPYDPTDPDDLDYELPNIQLENVVLIGNFLGEYL